MGRNEDLVSHADTARQLDITPKHLNHMVRQGHIRPAKTGRHWQDSRFRQSDINAYLSFRVRNMDLPKTANTAMQAYSLGLAATERLEKICLYLGLENNQLKIDEESVYQLHMRAKDELKGDPAELPASAVMDWATTLRAVDEAYLRIIEHYTQSAHPWELYLELANAMLAHPNTLAEANLKFAYACLDAARRNLRHVAYFYVLTRSGERLANAMFIEGAVDDEIMAQLYPVVDLPH